MANDESKTQTPEEEDFKSTPYTGYAEFNEAEEEDDDTRFLQYGRLFGASLGFGFEAATANRGALWSGGFPTLQIRLHYWFDFNFALDMGYMTSPHFFQNKTQDQIDVNLSHVGANLKYYFNTKDSGAAVSFSSPYILAGAGVFTKTETNTVTNTVDSDASFTPNFGGGFEFALKHRKVYTMLEAKLFFPKFKDTNTTKFTTLGIEDLRGLLYNVTFNIMFVW